jgi:hypothetical protein
MRGMLHAAQALGLVMFCAARSTVTRDVLAAGPLISQKGGIPSGHGRDRGGR